MKAVVNVGHEFTWARYEPVLFRKAFWLGLELQAAQLIRVESDHLHFIHINEALKGEVLSMALNVALVWQWFEF